MLEDLVRETNAPALTGFVMDSDCVDVRALGATSGPWRTCVDRAAMSAYLSEDGGNIDAQFLPAAGAAERAVAWAAEAGLPASSAGLELPFRDGHADPMAEDLFFELLDRLGVSTATDNVADRGHDGND
ncbi:MAG TPA: hypothetical protein VGL39_23975 [Jatrophihabitantaceae bacterium]|jgi:hypothetical protein